MKEKLMRKRRRCDTALGASLRSSPASIPAINQNRSHVFRTAGVPPALLTWFGHHVRPANQSQSFKPRRPRFPFFISPFPTLPAVAPPQTTPPPPPQTHST